MSIMKRVRNMIWGLELEPDHDDALEGLIYDVQDKFGWWRPDTERVSRNHDVFKKEGIAERVWTNYMFIRWWESPQSERLLVHYHSPKAKIIHGVSALADLCEEVARKAPEEHRQKKVIDFLWFCSMNYEDDTDRAKAQDENQEETVSRGSCSDSSNSSECSGCTGCSDCNERYQIGDDPVKMMLFSVLCRLLGRYPPNLVDIQDLKNYQKVHWSASIRRQLRLLTKLVRELPSEYLLMFCIDGVEHFEQPKFRKKAMKIFRCLVSLTQDNQVAATVKVLFTSTPGTKKVSKYFQGKDQILEIE